VTDPPHMSDGTELLAHEVIDEGKRLLTHPVSEVVRLEHVAADGESATTPLLVVLGVTLVAAAVFAVVAAIVLAVYYGV